MMKTYWLEQTEADLPKQSAYARTTGIIPLEEDGQNGQLTSYAQDGPGAGPELAWLSARELRQFKDLRTEKRRSDWQLGRWTAKHAVAACLCLPTDFPSLADIELRSAPSGAPEVFLCNKWAPVTISLSHRAGRAVCAVAPTLAALGCDLEIVERHSDAFLEDYFISEEQTLVAQAAAEDRAWLITLLWSAKESALKALHAGLRLDTRCVIVTPADALRRGDEDEGNSAPEELVLNSSFTLRPSDAGDIWRPLRVRHVNDQTLLGWWRRSGDLLRTVVAAPPPARPLLLEMPPRSPSLAGSEGEEAA